MAAELRLPWEKDHCSASVCRMQDKVKLWRCSSECTPAAAWLVEAMPRAEVTEMYLVHGYRRHGSVS